LIIKYELKTSLVWVKAQIKLKKNLKNESLVNNSSQNSIVNESLNDSSSLIGKRFIEGKSRFISEIERKYEITIEPKIIICGIDDTVLSFNDIFEPYFFFWRPVPKECFENSTSHIVDLDLFNCNNLDSVKILQGEGFNKKICKSDGSAFKKVDVLISITKNGISKQFNVNFPIIEDVFNFGSFREDLGKEQIEVIKNYFVLAFSNKDIEFDDYIFELLGRHSEKFSKSKK